MPREAQTELMTFLISELYTKTGIFTYDPGEQQEEKKRGKRTQGGEGESKEFCRIEGTTFRNWRRVRSLERMWTRIGRLIWGEIESDFLDVSYLLLFGELPSAIQKVEEGNGVAYSEY